jgi:hypothetical protein
MIRKREWLLSEPSRRVDPRRPVWPGWVEISQGMWGRPLHARGRKADRAVANCDLTFPTYYGGLEYEFGREAVGVSCDPPLEPPGSDVTVRRQPPMVRKFAPIAPTLT